MILGITGSSGTGKSTVCKILEKQYHAKTISADNIAKRLSQKGTEYLANIVQNFGADILLENGELNRKKLAEAIYQNSEKRELLNQCTFPSIKKEIQLQIEKATEKLIVIDAPLLFEAKLEKFCDDTIAVLTSNSKIQLQRMMKRDKINQEHAITRMKAQHDNEYYIDKCDYCIWNDNGIEQIEEQLREIMKNAFHFS